MTPIFEIFYPIGSLFFSPQVIGSDPIDPLFSEFSIQPNEEFSVLILKILRSNLPGTCMFYAYDKTYCMQLIAIVKQQKGN